MIKYMLSIRYFSDPNFKTTQSTTKAIATTKLASGTIAMMTGSSDNAKGTMTPTTVVKIPTTAKPTEPKTTKETCK